MSDRSLTDILDEAGLDRRAYLQLVGTVTLTGGLAGVAQGGDHEECQSIPVAIASDDGTIGDAEMLDAVTHWQDQTEVAGTCGKTIDDLTMLELVEMWRNGVDSTADIEAGVYEAENANSGYNADVAGESEDPGADLIQWRDNDQANQRFAVRAAGSDAYTLTAQHSDLVVGVDDSGNVLQQAADGSDDQRWQAADTDDGVRFLNAGNGQALSVEGASTETEATLVTEPYERSAYQHWTLERVRDVDPANGSPTASATADPSTATVGETVTLDASSSSGGDGSIASYEWKLDEETTKRGETVTHTFETAGDRTVTLTVSDEDGDTATTDLPLTVESAAGRQRWSDPATWDGEKPVEGEAVEITDEMDVLLDESPPALGGILVDGGSLTFARQDLALRTGYVVLQHGGTLEIGTEAEPFEQDATITLTGSRSDVDSAAVPCQDCGIKTIASIGGDLSIHGAVEGPTWTQLDATAEVGDTRITLTESVDWEAGDEIALPSTSLDPSHVDRRTITGVDGTTVELDDPLEHSHYGELQYFGPENQYEVDERGEVLNLSRNVLIQGDEASERDNFGGHVMAMNRHHDEQVARAESGEAWPDIWADYDTDPDLLPRISGVELRRMGQEGILARYPFHWHRYGDADGSYIRDCAIHDSYQRAVTVHGTQHATVENNVAFDVTGHCYFLEGRIEDGRPVEDFEEGTELRGNVAALVTRFSSEERELIVSDSAPSGFWTNGPPESTVVDNVAAGVYGHGFWIDLDSDAEESHKPRTKEDPGTWEGNVAHSIHSHDPSGTDQVDINQTVHHGIPTDGGAGFLIGGGDGDFHDLTAYKSVVGFWNDEAANLAIRDSTIADTRNALWFQDGGVDDSVVVAHTDNQTLETEADRERGYTVPEPGNTEMGSEESITGLVGFYQAARSKNTAYIGFDTDDEVPHGVFGTMGGITNNPYFAAGTHLVDSNPLLPNLPKEGRDLEIGSRVIPTADGGIVGEYDGNFDIGEFDGDEFRELRWGPEHLTDRESCEPLEYIGTRAGHEFDRYVYESTARSVQLTFPPGDYEVDGIVYEDIGGSGNLETGLTYSYQGTLSPEFGRDSSVRIELGYPGDYVVFAFPMESKPTLEHVGQPAKGDLVEVDSKAAVQSEASLENGRYYWDDGENTLWLRVVTNPEMANEFGTLPFKRSFELPVRRGRDNGVRFV